MRATTPHLLHRLGRIAVGAMLLATLVAPLHAQAPTPAPQRTPIPIEMDPNDPKASRAERIRRQQELLRRQIEERADRDRREAAGEIAEQEPASATPPPTPTPTPTPKPDDATAQQVAFYLAPARHIVESGQRFATEARLINNGAQTITRARVALNYPPALLRPVAIHDRALRALMEGDPDVSLREAEGLLIYDCVFNRVVDSIEIPLITVEWEALRPTARVEIAARSGEISSGAFRGQRFLSGGLGNEAPVTGAQVTINERPDETRLGLRMMNFSLDELQRNLGAANDQAALQLPRLWIDQNPDRSYLPGEWVVIDVGLDNPDALVFDEVRLALGFDPETVEIADTDKHNAIVEGTNILDGPFREQWGWDAFFANTVTQDEGTIYYRMQTSQRRALSGGTIARVFARIKRPTEGPLLRWLWQPQATALNPQTGVFALGQNVYLRDREPVPATAFQEDRIGEGETWIVGGIEKADPALYRFP